MSPTIYRDKGASQAFRQPVRRRSSDPGSHGGTTASSADRAQSQRERKCRSDSLRPFKPVSSRGATPKRGVGLALPARTDGGERLDFDLVHDGPLGVAGDHGQPAFRSESSHDGIDHWKVLVAVVGPKLARPSGYGVVERLRDEPESPKFGIGIVELPRPRSVDQRLCACDPQDEELAIA